MMKNHRKSFRFSLGALAAAALAVLFEPVPRSRLQLGGVAIEPDIKAALDKINDQVKGIADQALAEAKSAAGVSAKTKETADELLTKQTELRKQVEDVKAEVTDLLQKAQRSAQQTAAPSTPGEEVVSAEAFKTYVSEGNYKKAFQMSLKAVTNITSATTGTGGAGDLIAPNRLPGILGLPDRRLTVRDLITPGRTNSPLIQYVKETGYQNMVAPVAEGTAKPKSDIEYDLLSTPVIKLATYVKASTEILQDAPMLQSQIDGRLRFMLAYAEEAQLLNGSGSGNNLNGIYTQATAYAAPITLSGTPTRIDILRLAILQSELALFPATGIVIHPSDWTAIELTKDTTGAYVFANPQSLAQPVLWGRPVVGTPAMTVDSFLVGAFRLGAQVFDRMQASVMVSTENEDDFIKNMVTILIEERLGLAVYRPEAFIKGKITPAS